MRFRFFLQIVAIAWIGPFFSAAKLSADEPRAKKVLLIGIDGLRPDALLAAKTPYLDALVKGGAYADRTQILGQRYQKSDTISGPGWSSILTGVWADKHGVHDNQFRGARYRSYPHFFARLKGLRPDAVTASFVTWKPIAEKIVSEANHSRTFPPDDNTAGSYAKAEWQQAEEARKYIGSEDPDVVFVYFGLADAMGHTKGFHPNIPEYLSAIGMVDQCIGQVLRGMATRKSFSQEDWLVIITSDHGGKGKGHSRGHRDPDIHNVFLIVSGPSAVRGKIDQPTFIVDAPVTALAHLGVPLDPVWKLDGRVVGLKKNSENGGKPR